MTPRERCFVVGAAPTTGCTLSRIGGRIRLTFRMGNAVVNRMPPRLIPPAARYHGASFHRRRGQRDRSWVRPRVVRDAL